LATNLNIEHDILEQELVLVPQKVRKTTYKPKRQIKVRDITGRIFSILVGIIGLFFLIPVTLIVIVLHLINRENVPLFYSQKRIGLNGSAITIYKFNTMVNNAEQVLEDLMEQDPVIKQEYLLNKKLQNDPRILKSGKFLRQTSLDEFPQFINIIKGDMNLFGPRPYLFNEIDDMGKYYADIIKVKPGLTGPWQVNHRNEASFEHRLKIDSEYIKNKNFALEIKLFFKTLKVIICRTGK